MALEVLAAAMIELPGQQSGAAFEHGRLEAELVQRVRGLEAEQAAAGHDAALRADPLRVRAQRHRVRRLAQHARAGQAEALDLRDEGAGAGRQDQAVVVELLPRAQRHLALRTVDEQRARVQPRVDRPFVVPLVRVEVEPLHGAAAVDEPADAHAVVEVVRLLGDQVDLDTGVAPARVIGGGDAGDAVAEHDDALDALVVVEVEDLAQSRRGRLVRRQRDRDRARDAHAARHPRVLGVPEALERGLLVVGDRRGAAHPVLDRHRVGAADAHPAAGLDRHPVGLGDLQQAHPRLGRDALVVRQERDLRGAAPDGAQAAGAGQRGHAGRGHRAGGRGGLGARLLQERLLLADGAHEPGGGEDDRGGARRRSSARQDRRGPCGRPRCRRCRRRSRRTGW